MVEDKANKAIAKSGATCRQDYALKTGIPKKTDLEIIKNYAQALPAEGWTITNTNRSEDEEIYATQTKDGVESWAMSGRPTATRCMSCCCKSSRSAPASCR